MLGRFELTLSQGERDLLFTSARCGTCGHLNALHNTHCCPNCFVADCLCDEMNLNNCKCGHEEYMHLYDYETRGFCEYEHCDCEKYELGRPEEIK